MNCWPSGKYVNLLYMYSVLGRGSFCFNYWLNSAWHGGDQFVALLRWYGSPGSLSVDHFKSRRMTDELGSCQRDLSTSSVTKQANGHWHAAICIQLPAFQNTLLWKGEQLLQPLPLDWKAPVASYTHAVIIGSWMWITACQCPLARLVTLEVDSLSGEIPIRRSSDVMPPFPPSGNEGYICNRGVSLTVAFCSSAFFGLLFLIFLLTIPHRFSMGFRSGEFAGQSSTPTPWSLK